MSGVVSIGVAGALGAAAIARIAAAAESAGFHALWVNDTPSGDALAALTAAADATRTLVLATGVLPLDRRPAAAIAAAARALPAERVVLGVGSGGVRAGALELVREGVRRLSADTGARVMVGALGPRMRRLAATESAGPLLSWLTPEAASAHAGAAHRIAPTAHAALYVRTALDPHARGRLDDEISRYAAIASYAANFARLGIDARDTVVVPDEPERIARYRAGADEVVLRAITAHDDVDDHLRFVDRAAEATGRA